MLLLSSMESAEVLRLEAADASGVVLVATNVEVLVPPVAPEEIAAAMPEGCAAINPLMFVKATAAVPALALPTVNDADRPLSETADAGEEVLVEEKDPALIGNVTVPAPTIDWSAIDYADVVWSEMAYAGKEALEEVASAR